MGVKVVSSFVLYLVYPVFAVGLNIQPFTIIDSLTIDVAYLPKGHRAPFALVAVDHQQLNKTRDYIAALKASHQLTIESIDKRYQTDIIDLQLKTSKQLQALEVDLSHKAQQIKELTLEKEEIDKEHKLEINSYYWHNLGLSAALGASIIWAISASI